MRKFIAVLSAAALVAVIPGTPAMADGATIGEGGDCLGKVPDVNGVLAGELIQGDYKSRTTKSGITNFTCHFDLTDEQSPPKGTKATGFACGTPVGLTTDTRAQASPGGRMVMTCNIRSE